VTSAARTLPSACPLDCPDLCSLEVTVVDGRIERIGGTRVNPYTDGFLCSKVRNYADHVYHPTRIQHPLVRTGEKGAGEFRRASWDEALDLVAARLSAARDEHGGESILPLAYGGSNGLLTDHALDDLLFARLGASFLERTICAAPTGAAARALYGKMRGVAFEDYPEARLIVVWGTNPHATGIHLVPHLKRAQAAGARLVVVDPRRTPLAKAADLHLAVRPGTDLCVALCVIRELFEGRHADMDFLARHATGHAELRERARPWTLARAAREAALPEAELARFAAWYAESNPAVIRCGWGLERNRNGGSAVAAVLALPAVGGKFGVRGGGYTMSNSAALPLQPTVSAKGYGRAVSMTRGGRALLELDPPIRVLFVYNCNPLMTLPRQDLVRAGLEREDLFTVVHEQVMTDTARYADVVLPATTFFEHEELRRGYGAVAVAHASAVIAPVGEARPNYDVFRALAQRTGVWREGDPATPAELRANALAGRPDMAAALDRTGIALPENQRAIQFKDVMPATPDRKIHLCPPELDREAEGGLYAYHPDPATALHPLALISPAQSRTITSSLGELHTGLVPIQLHPEDAAARGLADGEHVRVFNPHGEVLTTLRVSAEMRPGTACLPKGLWSHNTEDGHTANALAPDTLSHVGAGACYNDARVEVTRAIRDSEALRT
jgi:anaerobic selenocysteine-containing dehydrogenase